LYEHRQFGQAEFAFLINPKRRIRIPDGEFAPFPWRQLTGGRRFASLWPARLNNFVGLIVQALQNCQIKRCAAAFQRPQE
jgi:hypothetical protein